MVDCSANLKMTKCLKCEQDFAAGQDIIACASCHNIYHLTLNCIEISPTELRVLQLKSGYSLIFKCRRCLNNGGADPLIAENIIDIKSTLDKVVLDTAKIEGLRTDVDSVKAEVLNIKSNISGIVAEEVNKLGLDQIGVAGTSNFPDGSGVNFGTIGEWEDRQKRMSNVIIHNLIDSDDAENDLSNITKVLVKTIDSNIRIVYVRRLGRFTENKDRPLIVKLWTVDMAMSVMRGKKRIMQIVGNKKTGQKLSATTDKTKMQQEQLRKAMTDLRARQAGGESNLLLKYIKGIPTVVEKKRMGPTAGDGVDEDITVDVE